LNGRSSVQKGQDTMSAAPEQRPSRYAQISRRRPWTILLVLALLALAIWGAWALAHNAKGGGAGGPGGGAGRRGGRPPTTVGVATVGTADVPVTLDALGTVIPVATITVRPQVSGVITQMLFREGQMVRKGQTLAIIDPRPFEMALMQAQGQLTRDEAQLANARLTLTRFRTLLAQDSIARQDVDTQAATVKQFEGVVMSDRAAVGTARLNLGYAHVAAPVNGRVGLRQVDVGNYISAGEANGLVVETQVAPIDVQFTVPQDQAPEILQRANRGVLPAQAMDRSGVAVLARGTFSTLDNQVDPASGTVRAKARFANADGALFPNQFVNIRVTLDTLRGALVTPLTAVRTGPNGDFVWIVRPDRTVTMRSVRRGLSTATQAVVLSGLTVGERVVTEGGDRLTEGGKIMLPGQGRGGRRAGGAAGAGSQGPRGAPGGAAQGGAGAPDRTPSGGTEPPAQAAPARRQDGSPTAPAASNTGGGASPSPEMQAARQAMRQACAADLQRLCPGQEGREAMMCLRDKAAQASAVCQAALAKAPRRRPGGEGQGGQGQGPG
jgi:multidrug efflux system membrane fusion protein